MIYFNKICQEKKTRTISGHSCGKYPFILQMIQEIAELPTTDS